MLLGLRDEEVEARGFRSFFALSSKRSSKALLRARQRFQLSSNRESYTASYLLFSSVQHEDKTQWRELTQTETMSRLIRACPWACYDTLVASPYLEMLSRLARQARGINLMAGTDLLDASEASRIVSSICRE